MAVPGSFATLLEEISKLDPKLAETTLQLEANWKTGESRDAELTELVAGVLRAAIDDGHFSLRTMVDGFNTFAHDFYERQIDFLSSGTYRARDYDEVSREVYGDERFMCTVYYPALVFSYLGAPNYRHMLRRFDQTLAAWRKEGVARLLDVASGHAFLLLFALNQLPGATGVGTDISPAAGHFAPAMHRATGWAPSRFRFAVTDVLVEGHPDLAEPFDAAICCELLEHVPEPALFLRAIHQRLRPGGRLPSPTAFRSWRPHFGQWRCSSGTFDSTSSVTSLVFATACSLRFRRASAAASSASRRTSRSIGGIFSVLWPWSCSFSRSSSTRRRSRSAIASIASSRQSQ